MEKSRTFNTNNHFKDTDCLKNLEKYGIHLFESWVGLTSWNWTNSLSNQEKIIDNNIWELVILSSKNILMEWSDMTLSSWTIKYPDFKVWNDKYLAFKKNDTINFYNISKNWKKVQINNDKNIWSFSLDDDDIFKYDWHNFIKVYFLDQTSWFLSLETWKVIYDNDFRNIKNIKFENNKTYICWTLHNWEYQEKEVNLDKILEVSIKDRIFKIIKNKLSSI